MGSCDLIAEQHSWARLPNDILSVIFSKLGAVNVLLSAQQVCRSWHQVTLDPSALFWRCIDMRELGDDIFGHINCDNLAKLAFDRSGGNVERFFAMAVSEDFLTHITDRTARLRCFGLILCMNDHPKVLLDFFSQCPQLEELHIYHCVFFHKQYRSITLGCPGLKCLYVDKMYRNRDIHANSDDEYNFLTCTDFLSFHKYDAHSDSDSDPNLYSFHDIELEFCPDGLSEPGFDRKPCSWNPQPNDGRKIIGPIPSSNSDHEFYPRKGTDDIIENEPVPSCLHVPIDGKVMEVAKNKTCITSISSSNSDLEHYEEEEIDLIIENEIDPGNWLDQNDLMDPEIAKNMPCIASILSSNSDLELYQEGETDLIIHYGIHPDNQDDLMALEIANNMLQLRELHLIRNRRLTNKGIHAILDKCLHLEYLNISCCFEVIVDESLQAKLSKIEAMKLSRQSQFRHHNN